MIQTNTTDDHVEIQAALLLMARHASKLKLTSFIATVNRAEASIKPTIDDSARRELVDNLARVKQLAQAFILVQEAFAELTENAIQRAAVKKRELHVATSEHVPEPPRAVFTGPDWDNQ